MTSDFSIHHYLEVIQRYIGAGYKLGQMKDLKEASQSKDKYLFLRHDVDLSLEAAYNMANYEDNLGIKSSYFIMLYSSIYNPLSTDGVKYIRSIADMGHEICYHADTRYSKSISADMRMLHEISQSEVGCYAPHFIRTSPPVTSKMLDPYETAINAMDYTHMNNVKDFHYLSDSSMMWREGCFCEHINSYRCLHVLIHPEWWIYSGDSMEIVNLAVEQEVSRLYKEGSEWKLIIQRDIRNMQNKLASEKKVLDIQLQSSGENEDLCRSSL